MLTKDKLIQMYYDGEIQMDNIDLCVQYGGLSWSHDRTNYYNEEQLNKEVEANGGWNIMIKKSLDIWAQACIDQGEIVTAVV